MADVDVSTLSPFDEPAWQAYVNSHPDATIYHTLGWRDILYNEYRFEPVYLVAKEEDRVVGVFPLFLIKNLRGKRLVSLPFSIYGGPIGNTANIVKMLLSASIKMVQEGKADSLEVRPYKSEVIEENGLISLEWGNVIKLDLTIGIDNLWGRITDKNKVNRAVREGLNFVILGKEGTEEFYKLQLVTRKRLGLPTPSLAYYSSFFDILKGSVRLALVKKEGIPVAGGLFFTYNGMIQYALSASDHRYFYSKPTDLFIWEMIKWGAERGFRLCDLGATSNSEKGLTHFKSKWGGRAYPVSRWYYPYMPKLDGTKGSSIFKKVPKSIGRIIGPKVIRLLG